MTSLFELSPSERRKNSTECIEVTREEFESVSDLVRGRVKLLDVNQVGLSFVFNASGSGGLGHIPSGIGCCYLCRCISSTCPA